MILFQSTKTQISPCIVSKAKFALGLKKDIPKNTKRCSNEYWKRAVKSVSKKYSLNDELKIESAINLYDKIIRNKHFIFLLLGLFVVNCKKPENNSSITQEGETGTVCYYAKKRLDMKITYQEMMEGEEKFGNSKTWSSQCCKSDEKYYFTKVSGLPEAWYEPGKTCK
jgi:hypothetical protein